MSQHHNTTAPPLGYILMHTTCLVAIYLKYTVAPNDLDMIGIWKIREAAEQVDSHQRKTKEVVSHDITKVSLHIRQTIVLHLSQTFNELRKENEMANKKMWSLDPLKLFFHKNGVQCEKKFDRQFDLIIIVEESNIPSQRECITKWGITLCMNYERLTRCCSVICHMSKQFCLTDRFHCSSLVLDKENKRETQHKERERKKGWTERRQRRSGGEEKEKKSTPGFKHELWCPQKGNSYTTTQSAGL